MAEKEISLDFSGIEPFLPLDASRKYLCVVSGLKHGLIKGGENKGQPKVSAEFTVTAPEKVMGEGSDGTKKEITAVNRKLFREYPMSAKAMPFFYEFLIAMGVPEKDLGAKFKFNPDNYLGNECCVSVVNEEYEEQIRSKPQKIQKASAFTG